MCLEACAPSQEKLGRVRSRTPRLEEKVFCWPRESKGNAGHWVCRRGQEAPLAGQTGQRLSLSGGGRPDRRRTCSLEETTGRKERGRSAGGVRRLLQGPGAQGAQQGGSRFLSAHLTWDMTRPEQGSILAPVFRSHVHMQVARPLRNNPSLMAFPPQNNISGNQARKASLPAPFTPHYPSPRQPVLA